MSTEMKEGFFVEEDKSGACFFSFIGIYGISSMSYSTMQCCNQLDTDFTITDERASL